MTIFFLQIFDHNDVCSKVDEPYCTRSSNLHELLTSHSKQNHNDFCLSYIFTYQPLSDSTLGLSWRANVYKGKHNRRTQLLFATGIEHGIQDRQVLKYISDI